RAAGGERPALCLRRGGGLCDLDHRGPRLCRRFSHPPQFVPFPDTRPANAALHCCRRERSMARFLSNPIGLKTGLALGVCVLALAACSIDDLRNPQSRSTLKGQEQAESRGSLTRGTQVAKPAPAPMSTYQVSGVAGDSEGPV